MYKYIYICINIFVYVYVCIYVCIYVYMCICICVYICIYIYICMYVYMCIYVCILLYVYSFDYYMYIRFCELWLWTAKRSYTRKINILVPFKLYLWWLFIVSCMFIIDGRPKINITLRRKATTSSQLFVTNRQPP